jgi:two-component system sensor histidine kinase PilS (NtrC family)
VSAKPADRKADASSLDNPKSRGCEEPTGAVTDDADQALRSRLSWLMFFRVILLTLLLVGIVAANYLTGSEARIRSPFIRASFGIIILLYLISIGYGLIYRRVVRLLPFFYGQLAIDLLAITFAVHITGGAGSGYSALYLIAIVAAAIIDVKRGAAVACLVSVALFLIISFLGYYRLLPLLPDQFHAHWLTRPEILLKNIVINIAAFGAVGVLSAHLGTLLGRAGRQASVHRKAFHKLSAHHDHILRSMTSALISTDSDSRILTFNDAAQKLWQIDDREAMGSRLEEISPELCSLSNSARLTLTKPDGEEMPAEVMVTDLVDERDRPEGKIYLINDRTEVERMEREVQKAERLAVLGRFAAGVAHEIRNPLASISGSIELLRQSSSTEGEDKKLMDIVLREVARLDELITEILSFARPAPPRLAHVDLFSTVSDIADLFEKDHPNVEVEKKLEQPVTVRADESKIRQVLLNLFLNASDAMGGVGRVDVVVGRDDGWAYCLVGDHGEGMEPEEVSRIFEPFYTTKEKGTGLGLAVVNQIVSDHGGRVEVESTPQQGTTIRLQLPSTRSDGGRAVEREA